MTTPKDKRRGYAVEKSGTKWGKSGTNLLNYNDFLQFHPELTGIR